MKFKKMIFIMLAMIFLFPMTRIYAETDANGVSVSKKATKKSEDNYTITFSIPDPVVVQGNLSVDVVLVLDKSSVSNLAGLVASYENLVDEMYNRTLVDNVTFNVGVIWFNADAHYGTQGLLDVSVPGNVAVLKAAISSYGGSGTNMHGGLLMAKDWLDQNTGTLDQNKFLFIASDFGGYLGDVGTINQNGTDYFSYGLGRYYEASGTAKSYWQEDFHTKYGYGLAHGLSDLTGMTFVEIDGLIRNMTLIDGTTADPYWMTTIGQLVGEYPYSAVPTDPSVIASLPTKSMYDAADVPTSWEKSIYLTGNLFLDMKASGYNMIAVTLDYLAASANRENVTAFIGAYQDWFEEYIGDRFDISAGEDVSTAFSSLSNDIFYLLGKGKIVDIVGPEFDFVPNSFSVSLDGAFLPMTDLGGNRYGFGTIMASGEYPFVASYQINSIGKEEITWEINASPDKIKVLELNFDIVHSHKKTAIGTHQAETNESAYLDYMNSRDAAGGSTIYTNRINMDSPIITYTNRGPSVPTASKDSILLYVGGLIVSAILLKTIKKQDNHGRSY